MNFRRRLPKRRGLVLIVDDNLEGAIVIEIANGEFFVVTFPRRPAAGAVETLTVTYADGTQDELELRF